MGVKSPWFLAAEQPLSECLRLVGRQIGTDVVDTERLPSERRRVRRIGLRRPALFARHVGLRHRTFLDRPDRLAGDAVEHVEPRGLARHDDDVAIAPVVADRDQLRRRAGVEVPEVVMHDLEMPQALARARLERDDRRAKEVGAWSCRPRRSRRWVSRAECRRCRAGHRPSSHPSC